MTITLSKSQYIKGTQCPLALWYNRNRPDLRPEITEEDQKRFSTGTEVGKLAREYFPGGVLVSELFDLQKAVQQTEAFINEGREILYEAAALHPRNGCHARADVLCKIPGTDEWDLIEVKSSTSVKDYHYDDIAFQYYVFSAAGFKIADCYIMHLNKDYVRQGDIDVQELFKLEDVTSNVYSRQSDMDLRVQSLIPLLSQSDQPEMDIGLHCEKPYGCAYKNHCWAHIPEYSVFNVYNKEKAFEIAAQTGSYQVRDIPPNRYPGGNKTTDILSFIRNELYFEKDTITGFLSQLIYPLYYLDYETFNPAVPLFNNSRPYQQIPFQFSLHIQQQPGADLEHHEFLHTDRTDPCADFVDALLECCSDRGSVVVWNAAFEQTRNKDLALAFPEAAEALHQINARMIDLMVPFRKRWIYHPQQCGSYSIKYVLPAFTDVSYDGMEIAGGSAASASYEAFMTGSLTAEDQHELWTALYRYCELDTLAMVEIARVLDDITKQ